MLKGILIVLFLLFPLIYCYPQVANSKYVTEEEYSKEINYIKRYNYFQKLKLNKEIEKSDKMQSEINLFKSQIDSLNGLLLFSIESNQELSDSLKVIYKMRSEAKTDIDQINHSFSRITLLWVIGSGIIIVLMISVLITLRGRYKKTISAFNSSFLQFKNEVNSASEERRQELDNKIVKIEQSLTQQNNRTKKLVLLNELMNRLPLGKKLASSEKELANIEKLVKKSSDTKDKDKTARRKIDHSLALKLANELYEIKHHLSILPNDTKGINVIKSKYDQMENILKSVGYELVDMEGLQLTDDMIKQSKLILPEGEDTENKTIKKVVLPQIRYNGQVVQNAVLELKPGK